MGLDDLARIGEFLGGLAILLSLLYLIVELKRQSSLAKATASAEWGRLFHNINFELARDPATSKLISRTFRAATSADDLTQDEYDQFVFLARGIYVGWRVIFDLQDKGGIAQDLYDEQMSAARSFLEIPVWRQWWETDGKASLGTEFVNEVENWKVRDVDSILDAFNSEH